jgi:hypothetical protein
MLKKISIVLLLVLTCAGAKAQTESYQKTLKKYFEVSGTMNAFQTAITTMMANFRNMNASVPDEFWKEMETELSGTSIDDLVKLMIPVYNRHLTETDLEEIIRFYSSPAGKKLASKTSVIMEESMQAGQTWGAAVAERIMKKMKEKGY